MANLKDSLSDSSKTVTLSEEDKAFLGHVNQFIQFKLDEIQQHIAGAILSRWAVEKFGMDANKDFQFSFDPEKKIDNLVITETIAEK